MCSLVTSIARGYHFAVFPGNDTAGCLNCTSQPKRTHEISDVATELTFQSSTFTGASPVLGIILTSLRNMYPLLGTRVLCRIGKHHLRSPQMQCWPCRSCATCLYASLAFSGCVTDGVHGMHHACMIPMHVDSTAMSAHNSTRCWGAAAGHACADASATGLHVKCMCMMPLQQGHMHVRGMCVMQSDRGASALAGDMPSDATKAE
jgi:hypothetical protein